MKGRIATIVNTTLISYYLYMLLYYTEELVISLSFFIFIQSLNIERII